MCSVKPLYELEVLPPRLKKVDSAIAQVVKKGLTANSVLDVFHELGWQNQIVYLPDAPESERFTFDLTNLQLVALAAALMAVAETGGRMVKSDVEPGTPDDPAAYVPPPPEEPMVLDGPVEPVPVLAPDFAPSPIDVADLFVEAPAPVAIDPIAPIAIDPIAPIAIDPIVQTGDDDIFAGLS